MGTLEAWRNMREVCIVGVGMHKFMKPGNNSVTEMGREAILAAWMMLALTSGTLRPVSAAVLPKSPAPVWAYSVR